MMQHISTTPFGRRAVSACLLASQALAAAPAPMPSIDKWHLFSDLREARARFGVSDRDLAVLNALLSFHPGRLLEDAGALIVFPSNATLSDRAHGMPESTLRRHLAALVTAGLLARHDSPNGKRYVTRAHGTVLRAFGFSLRPLLIRAPEIIAAATEARETALALRLTRERLVLCLRDCAKLLAFAEAEAMVAQGDALAARLGALRGLMRRKLDLAEMERLAEAAETLRAGLSARLEPALQTADSSGCDSHFERHSQDSKPELKESESCAEKIAAPPAASDSLPLELVVKACPDLLPYAGGGIRSWHELLATAQTLRPMMGVAADVWAEARRVMGAERAAVTLAAMLQRISAIQRPGAYLRHLTAKAAAGAFSPGPMIMALLSHAPAGARS
ncbi:plasmid replication protein RepC [Gemmobacter sp.]|uniref:plasmid replication protein RepC n=1 Tax=Gemmobacter sp. TaxID=1898957 RepID=UPI0025C28C99|nr:plasmid replication protein RepC [Gemmobacter sp.]